MPALHKGQPGKEVLGVSIKQTSQPALQMCSWLVSSRSSVCLASCSKSVSYSGHTLKFLSRIQALSGAPWLEARSFPAIPGASRDNPGGPARHLWQCPEYPWRPSPAWTWSQALASEQAFYLGSLVWCLVPEPLPWVSWANALFMKPPSEITSCPESQRARYFKFTKLLKAQQAFLPWKTQWWVFLFFF